MTRIAVPVLEEQRRITEILDTIDETIQAAERVIAKLGLIRLGLRERLCAYRRSSDQDTRLSELVTAVVDCPHSTPEYRRFGVLVARTMHIKNGQFAEGDASRVSGGHLPPACGQNGAESRRCGPHSRGTGGRSLYGSEENAGLPRSAGCLDTPWTGSPRTVPCGTHLFQPRTFTDSSTCRWNN